MRSSELPVPDVTPAVEAPIEAPAATVLAESVEPQAAPEAASAPVVAAVAEQASAVLATAPTLLAAPRVMNDGVPAAPSPVAPLLASSVAPSPSLHADADGACASSQPSGAHPVLRLPIEPSTNTPLVRTRAMACGKVVSFACTSLSAVRSSHASIVPVAPGSRESA
jgi:hypothetical protein